MITITLEEAIKKAAFALVKLLIFVMVLLSLSLQAGQLRKQNLGQLIELSHTIIHGRVKSVTDGISEKGIPFTEITVAVKSSAKNRVPPFSDYRFRQFGLTRAKTPSSNSSLMTIAQGLPRWTEGETVVAFLYKADVKTGLQATVGQEQGKLTVDGGKLNVRGDSDSLFSLVTIDRSLLTPQELQMVHSKEAIGVDSFMKIIDRIITEQWIEKGGMH